MLYGAYDFKLSQFLCKWDGEHWIEDLYSSWEEAYDNLKEDLSLTCVISACISDVPRVVEESELIFEEIVDYEKSLFLNLDL